MAWRVLWPHLDRYRRRYLAGVTLLLVTSAAALAIPWVVKHTVDAVAAGTGEAAQRAVIRGALLVIALALLQAATRAASRLAFLGASQRVEADLRAALFGRLVELSSDFYQRERTGDLMSRATNDLQAVLALIGFGFLSLISTAVVYLGTLLLMVRIDPWLTLLALAPYPALVGLIKRFSSRTHAESLAVQEQLSRLSARAQENLAGMAVVRAYALEGRETERFDAENAEHLRRLLRQARTQGAYAPLMGAIGGVGALVVLWLGGGAVIEGRITLGAFVAFGSYLAYLAWPTIALGWVLAMVRRGLAAMERVAAVLATAPTIRDASGLPPGGPPRGEVEFRRLTFAYDATRGPALREVSFRIPAGSCVALVGPTGAGKSTLAALLPRLWDPPPGTVFVDGREIHTYPLADLRRAIGYVPQEAFLFSRSLRENVALGGAAERSEAAARTASVLDEALALPEGWDTVVGERGLTLSGGQRQRVTLARALARDPRLLILDDAFASVDAAKEAEILGRLRPLLAGRTALVVTHRLRAAEAADRVVVLDEGRVVEEGRHADLVARGGLYARLWRRQALEAAVEAADRAPA